MSRRWRERLARWLAPELDASVREALEMLHLLQGKLGELDRNLVAMRSFREGLGQFTEVMQSRNLDLSRRNLALLDEIEILKRRLSQACQGWCHAELDQVRLELARKERLIGALLDREPRSIMKGGNPA